MEHIKPEPPEGHAIIFIGGVAALHIGLFFWVGANVQAIQDEKDLRHDADVHKLKMPTTEEQAAYRLAKIRYHEELERRNSSHDKAI